MPAFIKLTGPKTGRTIVVASRNLQCAWVDDKNPDLTTVYIAANATLHVKETPDEIFALLYGPAERGEAVDQRLTRLEDIVDQIAPTLA
jgi:hypothetical protein